MAYTRVLYQKLDAAFQASDADAVRRLSDPGCKTCERYEVALAKAAERGLRIRGSSFRILTAEAPPVEHDLAFVEVLIVSPPRASVRASGGGIEEDLPADPATRLTVILKYTGSGHWLLREIERAS